MVDPKKYWGGAIESFPGIEVKHCSGIDTSDYIADVRLDCARIISDMIGSAFGWDEYRKRTEALVKFVQTGEWGE